jgi:DNA polymerase II small subunit/DNA polymerase delta subunit B
MADYNPSRRDGLQNYISEITGRDAYGYPHNPSSFIKNVEDTFNELQELLIKKHIDYGPKNISESPGGPINGLRVRMHDKLARINNLVDKQVSNPQYESLEDSFKDMANYAIIGLLVLRDKWDR